MKEVTFRAPGQSGAASNLNLAYRLIKEVQNKHKSLYTNHRRLEEDITQMMDSSEFEHCKTIPCKQIRQTFDGADLELEALKQGLLDIDLKIPLKFKKSSDNNTSSNNYTSSINITSINTSSSLLNVSTSSRIQRISKSNDSLLL